MMTPADRNKVTFDDVAGVDEEKRRITRNCTIFKKKKIQRNLQIWEQEYQKVSY